MHIKKIIRTLAVSVLLALAAVSALAQSGKIEGDVKNDKGEPVVGAEVEIVRTDIKGNYPVKTDKKGHYLHAGVPYVGTYTIMVSAPGYRPDAVTNVRPDKPIEPFILKPGDGNKLTIEQVNKPAAATKGGAAGGSAPKMSEAELKKRNEEIEKHNKEVSDYKGRFEEMKKHFDAGQAALGKNDYAIAVTELKEATNLDPDQNQFVLYGNLAIALYNRGVIEINGGKRDEAKQSFLDSSVAADKALTILKTQMADPVKANDPGNKKNLSVFMKSKADASAILATKYGDAAAADTAAALYKEAAAATDDPAMKKTLLLKGAKTLFEAGKSPEAISAYQEIAQSDPDNIEVLYNLGLAFAGAAKFQESANTLQQFLDKAPPTDPRVTEVKAVIKDLVVGNNLQPPKAEKGSSSSKTKKKP